MSEKVYRVKYKYADPSEWGSDEPLYVKAHSKTEAREMGNYYKRAWNIHATIESVDEVEALKKQILAKCKSNIEHVGGIQIMLMDWIATGDFMKASEGIKSFKMYIDLATDYYYDCIQELKIAQDATENAKKYEESE